MKRTFLLLSGVALSALTACGSHDDGRNALIESGSRESPEWTVAALNLSSGGLGIGLLKAGGTAQQEYLSFVTIAVEELNQATAYAVYRSTHESVANPPSFSCDYVSQAQQPAMANCSGSLTIDEFPADHAVLGFTFDVTTTHGEYLHGTLRGVVTQY